MSYAIILLAIAAVAISAYLFLVFREVPGAIEERLGEYEALPQNLGQWCRDDDSPEATRATQDGLFREVRILVDEGGTFSGPKLIRQVRYRALESNKITRVDPDEDLKRRRVKK